MKQIKNILTIFIFSICSSAFAQNNSGIIGDWYNEEKDAIINIYEENNTFFGKIVWMKFPNDENGNAKTDPLNPDEKLRKRPRQGMVIMTNFQMNDDNVFEEGKIYDPKSGKTYDGNITLVNSNTLDLRGYVGHPIFGRTSTWSRKID